MKSTNRSLAVVFAGLITLAASAFFLPVASAGEYEVWSCRGPDGQPLSSEAWDPRINDAQSGDVWVTDDCLTGGPLTLHMNPAGTGPRRSRLDLAFRLPRGEKIGGYRMRRALHAAMPYGPPLNYVSAIREVTGPGWEDRGCASFLLLPDLNCTSRGDPSDPDAPANLEIRDGLDLDGLGAWVGCTAAAGCSPALQPPAAQFVLFQSVVRIEDDVAPVVERIGGALSGPGPVSGRADLFVEASDANAGIRSFELWIDGIHQETIPVQTARCQQPFVVARPCPELAGKAFTIDTDSLAEGDHVATGRVTDAAGNDTFFGPVTFRVESPEPPPANGLPAVSQPVLRLASSSIRTRPRAPGTIRGWLATSDGTPIAGATLGVEAGTLTSTGRRRHPLPPVTTGADGAFRVSVPGQGARQVAVSFAPRVGHAATATVSAEVTSNLRVRFRAAPRRIRIGRVVRFHGNVIGAGPASRGIPVEIQARVAGRWETVATVATRAGGRFIWRYRFRYVERDALFSFRAVTRSSPGWPWRQTASPVRKVRIMMRRR